jgi:cobalt transporter subunit CbtB
MAAATDSVTRRLARVRAELTPRTALALAVLAVLGATLLFAQDPAVHDSLHEFRHAAGITCH